MSEYLEKAKKALEEENYEELAIEANKVCNIDGDYKTGIDLLSNGLAKQPFNVSLRATRGRKYIGSYNYPCAIADLALASRLNPNDWEIWYYGGVAAYLNDEYEMCKQFHTEARKLMIENGIEALPATVDWYWMACMKLGQVKEANEVLDEYIDLDTPSEDGDYKARVLLYKGVYLPDNFIEEHMCGDEVADPERKVVYDLMLTYGLANYYHYHNQDDKANELCLKIAKYPKHHNLFAWAQACKDLKDRGISF